MKKIISACLALILLQFSGTVFAGFTTKSFSGPYGGIFSGDIYEAANPGIGPVGTLTMVFQLKANGIDKAVGSVNKLEITMNNGNLLIDEINSDNFDCDIINFESNGRGELQCSDPNASFRFVIVDSQILGDEILDIALGHHPRRVNNILLTGSFAGTLGFVIGTGQLNSQFK